MLRETVKGKTDELLRTEELYKQSQKDLEFFKKDNETYVTKSWCIIGKHQFEWGPGITEFKEPVVRKMHQSNGGCLAATVTTEHRQRVCEVVPGKRFPE